MSQDDQKDAEKRKQKPYALPDPDELRSSAASVEPSGTFRSAAMLDTSVPTSAFATSLMASQRDASAYALSSSLPKQPKSRVSGSKVMAVSSFVAPPRVGIGRFDCSPPTGAPSSLRPTVLLPFLRKDANLASAATKWAQQTPPTLPNNYPISPLSCAIDSSLTASEVLSNLVEGFRRMSIHVKYQPPSRSCCCAALSTFDDIELFMAVWLARVNGGLPQVVVELQPRRNDCDVEAQTKVARKILLAASGELDVDSPQDEERTETYYRALFESEALTQLEYARRQQSRDPASTWSQSHESLICFAHSLMTNPGSSSGGPLGALHAMSACRVGLETLATLVDPSKAGTAQSILASQIVLLGTDQLSDSVSFSDTEILRVYRDIHEVIVHVVQRRCLPPSLEADYKQQPGAMDWHVDTDGGDCFSGNTEGISPEHKRAMYRLFHTALSVLAGALHVVTTAAPAALQGQAEQSVLSPLLVVESFLVDASRLTQTNMITTLLDELQRSGTSPHTACLAASCLQHIAQTSPGALEQMSKLGGREYCKHAMEVGTTSHVKLEFHCSQLLAILGK